MNEHLNISVRNIEPSDEDRKKARDLVDSDQGILGAISTCESAMQLRDHVYSNLNVERDSNGDPLHGISKFESAVLSEAVSRWAKLHPTDKSE